MKMTGAQSLIKVLEHEGVEVIFGYPGAANCPIYDALTKSTIRDILPRSEQSASHEASGYSKVTGKVGVCMATSGPGATNLITGIATAYLDSVPMVAITGQVITDIIGKDGFQEVDITGACNPFTKHNYLITNVKDIPRIVREAFYIASTGRKGPVLIDIPMDISKQTFEFEMPGEPDIRGYKPTIKGHSFQIKKVCRALAEAKRPVIVAGGGIELSEAEEILSKVAHKYSIPVLMTLMGINGSVLCDDMRIGMIGLHGSSAANYCLGSSDLVVAIGCRFSDRTFITQANKSKKIVHIDIDPAEIGKIVDTLIPVVGDAKNILEEIYKSDFTVEVDQEWIEEIKIKRDKPVHFNKNDEFINPKYALRVLSSLYPKDTVITTEVGQNQIWAANHCKVYPEGKFITSGGLGTMGYGLPAAIGAKYGRPNSFVIAVEGDGSFQMSLGELATIVQWNLPIKIVLFNNGKLGMVREYQKMHYKANYIGVSLDGDPDFVKLAEAYGIKAKRIQTEDQLEDAFKEMLADDQAFLLEIMVDPFESTL